MKLNYPLALFGDEACLSSGREATATEIPLKPESLLLIDILEYFVFEREAFPWQ